MFLLHEIGINACLLVFEIKHDNVLYESKLESSPKTCMSSINSVTENSCQPIKTNENYQI